MDPVLQAFSGLMTVNKGVDGIPHRIGVIVCDMTTALYAFQAVAVSLYARRDNGEGRHIQANLMQGIACLQVVRMISNYLDGGRTVPGRVPSGTFPTADGWINILVFKEAEFPALCGIIGRPELAEDPRFSTNAARIENEETLIPMLNEACAKVDGATFSDGLEKARILHERVNDFFDFLKHPQVEATGLITWLEHPGMGAVPVPNAPGLPTLTPGDPRAKPPGLGEHTREILLAHGYGDGEIDDLMARKVLAG
jgi:crotonobetainyl-CoA:carnitine CoA-transferase CaiB-like acyl-CoA transferase